MKLARKPVKAKDRDWDVIVIGGGASGMMAAGRAAELGASVLVLEKNKTVGNKLAITGGGRCNITNAEFDTRELLKHYGSAEQYLYSPFAQFGVQDTFTFFEKLKIPFVIEARKRAFPKSQKATDVVRAMRDYMRDGKVSIDFETTVRKLQTNGDRISGVMCEGKTYTAKNVIIATGGTSHPETGSTGDGFAWLKKLGHTVRASNPTLVPLRTRTKWIPPLSGVSLSFMKITFFLDGKKAFSKTGKLLFTHFGLSGPLILNSSYEVSELLDQGAVTAKIDMYPDTDAGALDKRIVNTIDANKNKNFVNLLDEIVPHGMDTTVASLLNITDSNLKAHSFTKEDRKKLVTLLKGAPVEIAGLMGQDRAIVSDGGIVLDEIDTKTMRSRLFQNLYLTGDIIDINRLSGGYSLQLCWTTGFVAGTAAAGR